MGDRDSLIGLRADGTFGLTIGGDGCCGYGESAGDAGEDACDGFVDVGIREDFGGDIYEGDVDGEVHGDEVAVEAVGFSYAPAHLHSVYGMADFFLWNRDEELWAGCGLAEGRGRGIIRKVRVIRAIREL